MVFFKCFVWISCLLTLLSKAFCFAFFFGSKVMIARGGEGFSECLTLTRAHVVVECFLFFFVFLFFLKRLVVVSLLLQLLQKGLVQGRSVLCSLCVMFVANVNSEETSSCPCSVFFFKHCKLKID